MKFTAEGLKSIGPPNFGQQSKKIVLLFAMLLCGCDDSDNSIYTLYRNSPAAPSIRVHFATFDADEKESYNEGNCQLAADLLNKQAPPGIRWWCEKGRYRP